MSPRPCGWIVPPSDADFYFEDHYERGWADGSNLSAQGSSQGTQQRANWLDCVSAYGRTLGKPIGLAEYGLCSGSPSHNICSKNEPACLTQKPPPGSTTDDRKTMAADDSYLANEPRVFAGYRLSGLRARKGHRAS